MSVRWSWLAMVLALSAQSAPPPAVVPAAPQDPTPQGQRPPIFRSGAEVVRVDVTVLDGSGRPIRNLRAEDFQLSEEDDPQTIQSFTELDLSGEPADGREL